MIYKKSRHKRSNNVLALYKFNQPFFFRKNISIATSLLFISAAYNISYAETIKTDYNGTQSLIPITDIPGSLIYLIGNNKEGLISKNSNIFYTSNTEYNINYTNNLINPDFIISGYSSINDNLVDLKENTINLINGNANGNTYSGLGNNIEFQSEINCKTNTNNCNYISLEKKIDNKKITIESNTINLNSSYNNIGSLNSGYINLNNIIEKLESNNIKSSDPYEANINTNIDVNIDINKNNIISSNNNLEIKGSNNQISGNLESSYINLTNKINSVTGGNSIGLDSFSESNIDIKINNSNNNIQSQNNKINISGNSNNIIGGVSTGNINIKNYTESIAGGLSIANKNSSADAHSNTLLELISADNKIESKGNLINIQGENNKINGFIQVGNIDITNDLGSIIGGVSEGSYTNSETKSTIKINNNNYDNNSNTLYVSGNNHTLQDIFIGKIEIKNTIKSIHGGESNTFFRSTNSEYNSDTKVTLDASENYINSSNNKLIIKGNNHHTNGNINSGYVNFYVNYDDILGGSSSLNGVIKNSLLSFENKFTNLSIYSNENEINLEGFSNISSDLYTGYINFEINHGNIKNQNNLPVGIDIDLDNTKVFSLNNKINIKGFHTFDNVDSVIYGGFLKYNKTLGYSPESYDVFTGNTLNYNNRAPIKIKEIGNFQNYNFIIDSVIDNPKTPFITADKIILGSDTSNMSNASSNKLNSNIFVKEITGNKEIVNNTYYVLMRATKDREGYGFTNENHLIETVAQQGLSRVYDVDTFVYIKGANPNLDADMPNHVQNYDVIARIEGGPDDIGVETNPQLDALLLGNLSGLMLLTRNGDLLSNNLFNVISEQNYQRGLTPFIIASGNHTKYETGHHSYIKSDGSLTTIGLSWQDTQTTLGAFVENGWDSYTTFNGFTDVTNVSGKGHNRFNGVGLYSHYDFMNGWYADATLRGGRLHTAFETDDLRNVETDEKAAYKMSTNYYGANLEGGYSITFDPKNTVNLKAKYLWAQTDSQNLTVASEQIHFNKLDSHRVQFHVENMNKLTPKLTFISSLGYEHEFTGKAQGHASSYGFFEMNDQSVKGGTGISTLGLRYIPSQYKSLSIDAKATGYIGKRDGGMGMLKADYTF